MYNGANGDTFCEVLVSRRRGKPETVKAALANIVGLLFSAVIILLVPMFFILLIPVWALVIFVVRMQKLEYEYIFTSGELDIDVLIGNYKRKTRMSLSMEDITLVAPENSYELDGYRRNPNSHRYDFSANNVMQTNYVIIGNWNNQQIYVKFTPNEQILDAMFRTSPNKVRRR